MSENVYLINVILNDLLKGIWTDESIKAFNVVENKLKELDSLHHAYNELNFQNEEIIKENERLKNNYNLLDSTIESDDRTIFELLQENERLKNVIEILKDSLKLNLVLFDFGCDYVFKFVRSVNQINNISSEEFDLLKEVLENE